MLIPSTLFGSFQLNPPNAHHYIKVANFRNQTRNDAKKDVFIWKQGMYLQKARPIPSFI